VWDQASLEQRLRKIEALFAGTTSDGEREAARLAAERIRARLAEWRKRELDVAMAYSLPDPWQRKLFLALCRRYELKPYREYRQRSSTVMLRAPEPFHKKTLWPEFTALAAELDKALSELTDRIIRDVIHGDVSEALEGEPKLLPSGDPSDGG
jgi:hypothetical protein